jgi:hypothetical protein
MKAFASSHILVTSLSALLLVMGAGSATAQAAPKGAAPTVQITEKARELFRTGVTLLQDPDGARYEEAYEQFKAAYAESPSWKILGNLGVTAMKLERDGEAIQAFQGYLEQGGKELSRDERAQFQSDLDTLSATTATVTISGLPAGTRVTDVRSANKGDDVKNYYDVPEGGSLVLRVRPGVHRFTAQWADQAAQTHELETSSKGTHEVKFEAAKPAPVEAPPPAPVVAPAPAPTTSGSAHEGFWQSPVPMYVSFGVGAVGVGMGVLFLTQRSAAVSDGDSKYKACLASQACLTSDQLAMQRLDHKASTRGTLSVVSFGVGAVGVGAGVTLLLMQGKKEAAVTAAGMTIQPYATGNELGLWGQF